MNARVSGFQKTKMSPPGFLGAIFLAYTATSNAGTKKGRWQKPAPFDESSAIRAYGSV
jgi:hypothetical protein